MNLFQYISREFKKIFESRTATISIVVALLVPLVYAMIILSPEWGPLDNLDNVPVAIVNNDEGADNEGEYVNVGDQLVETLEDDDQLGWDFVTEEEAMRGMENQEYFMTVIVPPDFSEKTVTVMDDDPQHPELKYIQNEGMHFQGATVTDAAIESLESQLATQITETYVQTVFDQLGEVRDGFAEAHDGSEQIEDGAGQLKDGSAEILMNLVDSAPDIDRLADGGGQLKDGTIQLRDGAGQLHDGTQEAKAGSEQLIAEGLGQLVPGSQELYEGTLEAQEGVHETMEKMERLQESLNHLSTMNKDSPAYDGIMNQTLEELNESMKENPQKKKDFGRLVDGAQQLRDGIHGDFQDGVYQLDDGLRQLRDGAAELLAGTIELDEGATELAEGTLTVQEGWGALTDGMTQVDDGMLELLEGSGELEEGLRGGRERTADLNPTEANEIMFAAPVVLDGEVVNNFQYYRDANAPYIITLALFVGVFALSFVVPFRRPAVTPANGFTWFIGKVTQLTVLTIIQALVISLFALFVLKMQVQSSLALVLFSVYVSLTFLMILLFLFAAAGNVGRFIALIFVVLQLSTTGSDLPIHMLPEGLRDMSTFLPFTYSIDGYQNIITLGDMSRVWSDVTVLFIYFALFAVLSLIVFLIRHRFLKNIEESYEDEETEVAS